MDNTGSLNLKRNHVKKNYKEIFNKRLYNNGPLSYTFRTKRFCENLYKAKTTDSDDSVKTFLNDLNIPQLSEQQKLSCEGGIWIKECKKILETFESNKPSGTDGISIESYKNCWNLICEPFLNCVKEVCKSGQ